MFLPKETNPEKCLMETEFGRRSKGPCYHMQFGEALTTLPHDDFQSLRDQRRVTLKTEGTSRPQKVPCTWNKKWYLQLGREKYVKNNESLSPFDKTQ